MKKFKLNIRQYYHLRRDGEIRIGLSGNSKQRRKMKRAIARSGEYEVIDQKRHWFKYVIVRKAGKND